MEKAGSLAPLATGLDITPVHELSYHCTIQAPENNVEIFVFMSLNC